MPVLANFPSSPNNNSLTAEELKEILADEYISKNQGAENVGLILCVGTDGNLVLVPMPETTIEGDVAGVLDDSNNILLTGNLTNGTYQLRWSLGDGTYVDAGELIVSQSGYSIATSLSHCSASGAASIRGNGSATIVITADDGYTLPNNITVSGAEYTWDNNTGMIVLSNPTSDVYISVTAVTAVIVNIGLVEETRVSISAADRTSASGHTTTEWIDLTSIPKPCTIHLTGIIWAALSSDAYISTVAHATKDVTGNKLCGNYTYPLENNYHQIVVNNDAGTDVTVTIESDDAAQVIFGGKGAMANASVTLTYTPES